uniref:Nucleotide-binding protein n=1 Tax=Cyanothece sp. (strain PCC 7425 / ATCC 29141) TaxID=395961 RepID=B8HV70_CYAP4
MTIHVKEHRSVSTPIATLPLTDRFADGCKAGQVIGTTTVTGHHRQGVDAEQQLAIDNHALRMQPLLKPGWGRQGVVYGPYKRSSGLAMVVFLLNGHNTSQAEPLNESLINRLKMWLRGSDADTRRNRVRRWLGSRHMQRVGRRLLLWISSHPKLNRFFVPLPLDENLAVGWFAQKSPDNPGNQGNTFIVHATGPENGELWASVGSNALSAFRGFQNLQTYYMVVLREQGAAYYAASLPNAHGLVGYPNLRPIAIDPFHADPTVYAGFYQSVLGQVGFWVDTRVYGVHVALVPQLATWYGTAHAAATLQGDCLLNATTADIGGAWTIYGGQFRLTAQGAVPVAAQNLAVLSPTNPSGLIHTLMETTATISDIALVWRFSDPQNYWCLQLRAQECKLQLQLDGTWITIATTTNCHLLPDTVHSVQILDDRTTFNLYLNGIRLFETEITDSRLHRSTGVGIAAPAASDALFIRNFEAHPRQVLLTDGFDLGAPWTAAGTQVVLTENFAGEAGELSANTLLSGQLWQKEMGHGVIELTGNRAAKVRANAKQHCPGRTVYTLPWNHPNFADVCVEITPPGSDRGQGEKGRGGLIFWQDPDNYIIINNWLDDVYGGASISSFFQIDGFEEIFDAVWSNVGSRIFWGVPHTLRVVFDGMHYLVFLNDEPVLYRALTDVYATMSPLRIHKIGIVANWEWGTDTGTVFRNFVAQV